MGDKYLRRKDDTSNGRIYGAKFSDEKRQLGRALARASVGPRRQKGGESLDETETVKSQAPFQVSSTKAHRELICNGKSKFMCEKEKQV